MPMPFLRAANSRNNKPLPDPWPALANSRFEVQFLPAQFYMIAGPSGAGKSFMALDAAIKMNIPTLYLSCDSDEMTVVVRAAAAVTKHSQRDVRETYKRGLFKEVYGDALRDSVIRLSFDPSNPTMQDIAHILEAEYEINGEYPRLIILDNVMNLEGDSGGNEWGFLRKATKDLHWIARKTKACLVGLHHTSEPDPRWTKETPKAPPKSSIKGNITEMAPVILTVSHDAGEMWVAVVKNRFGQSDPLAKDPLRFIADLSRAQIWDEPEMVGQTRENAWLASGKPHIPREGW